MIVLLSFQVSRIETELAVRRELIIAQCGVELSSHPHPYYCYLLNRLRDLQLRQRELTENSVHRPQQQQVNLVTLSLMFMRTCEV